MRDVGRYRKDAGLSYSLHQRASGMQLHSSCICRHLGAELARNICRRGAMSMRILHAAFAFVTAAGLALCGTAAVLAQAGGARPGTTPPANPMAPAGGTNQGTTPATPATPAQPGQPGGGATPASPATPATPNQA